MKNIDMPLLVCLFCYLCVQGQTQSLSDAFVAGQKTKITQALAREMIQKGQQHALLRALKMEEDTYADKRGALGNISNSMVYVALLGMIRSTEAKIVAVEHNIWLNKLRSLGFRHGLKGYESRLANEKRYFEKLKDEYKLLNQCLLVSGGSGYNYTAFLRLLLRMMEVRQHILLLDKEVKTLMNFNAILAK